MYAHNAGYGRGVRLPGDELVDKFDSGFSPLVGKVVTGLPDDHGLALWIFRCQTLVGVGDMEFAVLGLSTKVGQVTLRRIFFSSASDGLIPAIEGSVVHGIRNRPESSKIKIDDLTSINDLSALGNRDMTVVT